MSVQKSLQLKKQKIEERLDCLVAKKRGPTASLHQAARYLLLNPEKKCLRPLLTLITAEMLGRKLSHALNPACAIEMIHTYSLIHDDLPCMDDDDMRRGKLALHKKYSEAHAVLTGDFLLTYAFEVLAQAPHLSSEQKVELVSLLAQASGADGMIGGQLIDLEVSGKRFLLEDMKELHQKKTASLITVAVIFGAVVAEAEEREKEILKRFGQKIGVAFQVVDDLLDDFSEKKETGRKDAIKVLGKKEATKYANELLSSAKQELCKLSYDTSSLNYLADCLVHRLN